VWHGYVSAVLHIGNSRNDYMHHANQKKDKYKFISCIKISQVRWLLAQISRTSAADAGMPVTDLLSLQCAVRHFKGLPVTDLLSLQRTVRHLMQYRRTL